MVKENTECPGCGVVTDLYRGENGRYRCLRCWIEMKGYIQPSRGNGKSHKIFHIKG